MPLQYLISTACGCYICILVQQSVQTKQSYTKLLHQASSCILSVSFIIQSANCHNQCVRYSHKSTLTIYFFAPLRLAVQHQPGMYQSAEAYLTRQPLCSISAFSGKIYAKPAAWLPSSSEIVTQSSVYWLPIYWLPCYITTYQQVSAARTACYMTHTSSAQSVQ